MTVLCPVNWDSFGLWKFEPGKCVESLILPSGPAPKVYQTTDLQPSGLRLSLQSGLIDFAYLSLIYTGG